MSSLSQERAEDAYRRTLQNIIHYSNSKDGARCTPRGLLRADTVVLRDAEITLVLKHAYIQRPLYAKNDILALLLRGTAGEEEIMVDFEIVDERDSTQRWEQALKIYDEV